MAFSLTKRYSPDRTACEEHNPLQSFVIKEVVEGPQVAFFPIRVGIQIWIVAVTECNQSLLNNLVMYHSNKHYSKACIKF